MKHTLSAFVAMTICLFIVPSADAQPLKVITSTQKATQAGTQIGKTWEIIIPQVETNLLRAIQQAKFALPDPTHNASDRIEMEKMLSEYHQITACPISSIHDIAKAAALAKNESWVHYTVLHGADVNQAIVEAIDAKDGFAFANRLFEIYRPTPQSLEQLLIQVAEQPFAEEKVVWLIKHGVNPNATDAFGDGVLHKLARRGFFEEQTLDVLKEAGANFNLTNKFEMTPLFPALTHPLFVEALLERGTNPFQEDIDGLTPAQKARQKLQDPSLDKRTINALNKSIDILEISETEQRFGGAFADLQWQDYYDFKQLNALRKKLKSENLPNPTQVPADAQELEQLMEKYAFLLDPSGKISPINTAKMACMSGKDRWAFVALWYKADPADVLFYALSYGRYELADKLITKYHANPNGKIQEWGEPLPIALARSSTQGMLWLLERFNGQVVLNTPYTSALHSAAEGGQTELIVPLKQAGLDINILDKYSNTLLGAIHVMRHPDFLEKALQEGADPSIGNPLNHINFFQKTMTEGNDWITPEEIATVAKSKEILEKALQERANQ